MNHRSARESATEWLRRYHDPKCRAWLYIAGKAYGPDCDCNGDPLGDEAISPVDHMPKTLDAEGRSLDATYSY